MSTTAVRHINCLPLPLKRLSLRKNAADSTARIILQLTMTATNFYKTVQISIATGVVFHRQ